MLSILIAPLLILLPAADEPKAHGVADPLAALNEASLAAYQRAKEAALARPGPLILVEGDVLVLRHGGRRIEAQFIPRIYHELKAIAHVPLAIDVTLATATDGDRLGDDVLDELGRYGRRVEAARERVRSLGLGPEQARRQDDILSGSLDFLGTLSRAKSCGEAERVAFARRMAPLVLANVADAARAELDALHGQVGRWKDEMPAEDWVRLTVIVLGRPLPRRDNLAVQYFARRLGEPGEGRRVVYAESLAEEGALGLLATHRVDTRVGRDFFDDPGRMHRDLLGDAAREYLDRLLPPIEK